MNLIRENARQAATGDSAFLKKLLYYFELTLPPQSTRGPTNSFLFPLALNPESYAMSEPFTLETAYTQGAGIFVEENGIIGRTIMLRGQTGFRPRNLLAQPAQLSATHSGTKSYSRTLPSSVLDAVSGHRHFMYLQDAVFRTYADFKRDPSTAAQTFLYFHNPQDSEHWLVSPRNFKLSRDKSEPFSYRYDIELLVLDKADWSFAIKSEDKNPLDRLKNKFQTIQNAINLATGALTDLSNLAGELKAVVQNFQKIVANVTTVVIAAHNFLGATTALIQAPFAIVGETIRLLENSLLLHAKILSTGQQIADIPKTTMQSLRQIGDAMAFFGLHPTAFETPAQAKLRVVKKSQQISLSNTPSELALAAATPPPSSFSQVNNLGTGLMAGDLARSQAQSTVGAEVLAYTGTQQYQIAKGDTLVNLAARFLGDARLWQYLATINGLKPPFVDSQASAVLAGAESGLSGSVGLGTTILIPNFADPPENQPLLPVLGVGPEDSADVHLLGRDLLLQGVVNTTQYAQIGSSGSVYDLVIDTERGSIDVKVVAGIPNYAQAAVTSMITERGSDTLYQGVGIAPIVSLNMTTIDLETARFRIQQALASDARISGVQGVQFTTAEDDTLVVDVIVALRGFAQPTSVKVTI